MHWARCRVVVESDSAVVDSALAVSCPRCGGVPDPEGGPGHLARCRQCGILGRLHDPLSRQRLVARRCLDLDAALSVLGKSAVPNGEPGPGLLSSELLYVPFWRTEAIVAGRVRGQRERLERDVERVIDDQGLARYTTRRETGPPQEIDHEVQRMHTVFVSACPLTELGLPLLDHHRQQPGALALPQSPNGSVVFDVFSPSLRDDATVLDSLVPEHVASAEAALVLSALSAGITSSLLPGAQAHTEILHNETTLIFWPVWHLRFAVGATRGEALIDGVGGGAIAVRLVEANSHNLFAKRLFGLIALSAGLFCGAIMRLSLAPPSWLAGEEEGSARLKLLCVGAAATFTCWRALKYVLQQHLGKTK